MTYAKKCAELKAALYELARAKAERDVTSLQEAIGRYAGTVESYDAKLALDELLEEADALAVDAPIHKVLNRLVAERDQLAGQVIKVRLDEEEMIDYSDVDSECVDLCKAMSRYPGIQTTSSCCGHGEHPYQIFFWADKVEYLPYVLYWFDACHNGVYRWPVEIYTDCAMSPVTFMVEGPTGKPAYEQSKKIAHLMNAWLDERAHVEGPGFGIGIDPK